MGCGASKDPKVAVADSQKNTYNNKSSRSNNNGFKQVDLKKSYNEPYDYNSRPTSDKKPLAFVIEFDEKKNTTSRPPPGRLQLEPIKKASPNQQQEKLDDKMRLAEINRQKILNNRVKSSKTRGGNSNTNSRQNSGSMNGSSYYNNDSRKMSKDDREYNFNYDSQNNQNHNGSNSNNNNGMERSEEEEKRRARLLKVRRIEKNPVSDDEDRIEHNRKNSDEDEYYGRRGNRRNS